MKKYILIFVLITLSFQGMAQKNRIRLFGYNLDLLAANFTLPNNVEQTVSTYTNYNFGYERLIGNKVVLGLAYYHYIEPTGFASFYNNIGYIGSYFENPTYGLSYHSKYFISDFDEQPIGLYIGSTFMFTNIQQKQGNLEDYTLTSGSLTEIDNNYGIYRLGILLGVHGIGDLHVGYMLNMGGGGRIENGLHQKWNPINSGNFILGYNIGLNF
jgi:hypothetical protein